MSDFDDKTSSSVSFSSTDPMRQRFGDETKSEKCHLACEDLAWLKTEGDEYIMVEYHDMVENDDWSSEGSAAVTFTDLGT